MSDRTKKPCSIFIIRKIELPSSSIINKMMYDVNTNTLRVTFHAQGGDFPRTYEYRNVPEETVKEMINSESVGSYFRKNIRDNFDTEEIFE